MEDEVVEEDEVVGCDGGHTRTHTHTQTHTHLVNNPVEEHHTRQRDDRREEHINHHAHVPDVQLDLNGGRRSRGIYIIVRRMRSGSWSKHGHALS